MARIEAQESVVDELVNRRRLLIEFKSTLTVTDIPDATCEFCGLPMDKVYVEHNFGFGESFVKFRTKVPGYHCSQDGDCFSDEGVLASLAAARDLLLERDLKTEAKKWGDSLEHYKRILTLA